MSDADRPDGKLYPDMEAALADFSDGASLMVGGFGLSGNPENAIAEIARRRPRNLTVISNNCGNQGRGLAVLLRQRQIRKCICSFIGGNPDLQEQLLAGELEVELNPQGTLAERIRAGGAGIGGFFTPTGVGTAVADGKEERTLDGKRMIFETALTADFAILRAYQADPFGNLRFYGTSRNFSPLMAMAARVSVVEVEHFVPLGAIPAEDVHLPGVFVKRLVQGRSYENLIEQLTTRPRPNP